MCVLGYTNQLKRLSPDAAHDGLSGGSHEQPLDAAKGLFPDTWDEIYALIDATANPPHFFAADVPPEVIDFDRRMRVRWRRMSIVDAFIAGLTTDAAASISVPVFLGFVDVDNTPDAHRDVSDYRASRDVTLFVLNGSAHCHNFAARRRELWDRIDRWTREV